MVILNPSNLYILMLNICMFIINIFMHINHEFLFGCGAFDALPATAKENPADIAFYQDKVAPKKEFYQDRVNKWLDVFNYFTLLQYQYHQQYC